ncbi:MAG: EAL domain-containing protein [Acetobacteraceae bacterium]|nr:EAL domain-containing protein [Acetobacteraceae bacterium]
MLRVLDHLPHGLAVFGPDLRLLVCNAFYREKVGHCPAVVRPGAHLRDIIASAAERGLHLSGSTESIFAQRTASFARGASFRLLNSIGDRVFETLYEPTADGCWILLHFDVTERERAVQAQRQSDEALRLQQVRFDAALENMSHGISIYDGNERLMFKNRRNYELFGYDTGTVHVGMTLREVCAAAVEQGIASASDPEDHYRFRLAQIEGGRDNRFLDTLRCGRVVACRHQKLPGGGWISVFEDVTDVRRAEQQIEHMARHDALTGVGNRVLFRERLVDALTRAGRGERCAVLCLDLDKFKQVNDTLGHLVGDALLKEVATRLRREVRSTDTVARYGGDEFVILQSSVAHIADVTALAQRLIEVLGQPYLLDSHRVGVSASVGIAVAPDDGTDPDMLLKSADLALYQVKSEGRNGWRFFEREMDLRMQSRRTLELDLRRALEADEFELLYQPLVHARTQMPTGFEALVRWRRPGRGLVSPGVFLPVAEEIGLIGAIDLWVLRRACMDAADWPDHVRVAVNLSASQFRVRGGLVDAVRQALQQAGLPARRLELEITESVMLQDSAEVLATLHQLRDLGVAIAMDDFGTGYSSLSYLRRFPFDKVKIDRSFIPGLAEGSHDSTAIVRAVIGLCADLRMRVTAEGVETAEQLERLVEEGCTEVQGFLFSRPVPADVLPRLLRGEWRTGGTEADELPQGEPALLDS